MGVKGSQICQPWICLFGIMIILSWLFLRNSRHRRNSQNRVQVTLLYETLTCIREISICSIFPHQEEGDNEISKTLINGEGKNLDLHITPTCVHHAFPGHLPLLASLFPATFSSCLYLKKVLKVFTWLISRELLSFPIYLSCTQEEYKFLNFCLFSPC